MRIQIFVCGRRCCVPFLCIGLLCEGSNDPLLRLASLDDDWTQIFPCTDGLQDGVQTLHCPTFTGQAATQLALRHVWLFSADAAQALALDPCRCCLSRSPRPEMEPHKAKPLT